MKFFFNRFFTNFFNHFFLDIKESYFIFGYVLFIVYYSCHKIKSNHYGSYIDSLDWIKNKRTINVINKNGNKCFQYAIIGALHHKKIGKNSQRISKFKLYK